MPIPDLPPLPSEAEYLNCIRCGLCLAVCPTYRESLHEIASPRGRLMLARKGLQGELDLRSNLYEQMYACFDCLACNEVCPVGIRPADLAVEMRRVQEQAGPQFWKKVVFNRFLQNPDWLEAATLPVRLYERLGIRGLVHALGLQKILPRRLRDMEAMLPRAPRRPLRQILPEVTSAGGESKRRVGFFLGCAQNLMYADESAAAVRVLARNGSTVVTPKDVVCCGMPARSYGRMEDARAQARRNIELFETADVETVVTDCATCGATLKSYGAFLGDDPVWAERAAAFSAKIRDVSEFLLSIPMENPAKRIAARVTYHDPCHLRRGQGVWKQPRELLKMIGGVEFVELPEADVCCGMAGTQIITHYEMSIKVLMRKLDNLAKTGADCVASGCPVCRMQLTTGLARAGLSMRVTHPVVLLDEAYHSDL
ncbi:MAG: (Fe-S)-binding protein [Anaerolineales bacterium]|nr:(Fe-S)-binding protein [Anaerolineales bacterium]